MTLKRRNKVHLVLIEYIMLDCPRNNHSGDLRMRSSPCRNTTLSNNARNNAALSQWVITRSLAIYLAFVALCAVLLTVLARLNSFEIGNDICKIILATALGFPLYMLMVITGSLFGLKILEKLTSPNLNRDEVNMVLWLWFTCSFVGSIFIGPELCRSIPSVFYFFQHILESLRLVAGGKEAFFFVDSYIFQFLSGFGVGMLLRERSSGKDKKH
ncbi:MAG: hypothetical protein RDV48_30795 [Candidatus Eremiobacteraeota bacterium]|nr:hypothetical protein [Candidatus Eremiobacteraeota bacterium]